MVRGGVRRVDVVGAVLLAVTLIGGCQNRDTDQRRGDGWTVGGGDSGAEVEPVPDTTSADTGGGDAAAGWRQVSTGSSHSCAVDSLGGVVCWGEDDEGESSPPDRAFTRVSVGTDVSCGLTVSNAIECWGEMNEAEPPDGRFKALSVSGSRACGITLEGALNCWGEEFRGDPPPTTGTFAEVSLGGLASMAIRRAGGLVQWGHRLSYVGQHAFSEIDTEASHACGVDRASDRVVCWGDNESGQAEPPEGRFEQVGIGYYFSCGLTKAGAIECWGDGSDSKTDSPSGSYRSISVGAFHSCAVSTGGEIDCWGRRKEATPWEPGG